MGENYCKINLEQAPDGRICYRGSFQPGSSGCGLVSRTLDAVIPGLLEHIPKDVPQGTIYYILSCVPWYSDDARNARHKPLEEDKIREIKEQLRKARPDLTIQ